MILQFYMCTDHFGGRSYHGNLNGVDSLFFMYYKDQTMVILAQKEITYYFYSIIFYIK